MSVTISPNMSLIIPGVGTEAGPTYATDINNSLNIIDQHTHAPGSGVLITPAAININAALTLSGNFLTNAAGMKFTAQGSTPASNTIYQSSNDLYFVDGVGNNVRITQSGSIAGTPGSIANLVSPASASYVAIGTTFVWQSGVNLAANMDAASYLLRNISPNSTYALTLAPPTLSNDYTITLPILPASNLPMSINSSGTVTAVLLTGAQIAGTTITASNIANATITTTQISASAAITGSQLAAAAGITGSQLAASTVSAAKMASNSITTANGAIEANINLTGIPSAGGFRIAVNKGGMNGITNGIFGTLAGTVTGAGSYSGFSVSTVGLRAVIAFSANFAGAPVVFAFPVGSGFYPTYTTYSQGVSGCQIEDPSGTIYPFNFMAYGQLA